MSRYNAKTKRRGRIFFLSARISHHLNQETGLRSAFVQRPGMTYRRKEPNVRQTRQVRKQRKAAKSAAKEAA